jgi:MoxR-like ATPase
MVMSVNRTPRSATTRRAATDARREARSMTEPLTRELFQERFEAMVANIGRVMKGKDDVVRLALVGLLAQGHILFEDLPGTGKTMLARSIAQTINAKQSRVQCTPDLLPADITGSATLDRKTGDFVFRVPRGPGVRQHLPG